MQVSKRISLIFMVFAFLGLMYSCQKELNAAEYKAFVSSPENGLRVDQTMGDFELSVMYEPVEYKIAQENLVVSKEDYEAYEHFQFRIKLKSGGDILMYQETREQNEVTRINHFGFMAQNDFRILSNADTSYCKMVHFSRNYNLSPTIDLSLVFDAIPKNGDWQLIYDDKQFNLGRIKFLFKEEALNNLPALKK